jgi:hypothetical protein
MSTCSESSMQAFGVYLEVGSPRKFMRLPSRRAIQCLDGKSHQTSQLGLFWLRPWVVGSKTLEHLEPILNYHCGVRKQCRRCLETWLHLCYVASAWILIHTRVKFKKIATQIIRTLFRFVFHSSFLLRWLIFTLSKSGDLGLPVLNFPAMNKQLVSTSMAFRFTCLHGLYLSKEAFNIQSDQQG